MELTATNRSQAYPEKAEKAGQVSKAYELPAFEVVVGSSPERT